MKIHIVQKGDTLWKIAKKYGVDFEELKKINSHLSNPDMIMPGMKIKIPAAGDTVKMGDGKKGFWGAKKEIPLKEYPKEFPLKEEAVEVPVKEPAKEIPKPPPPKMEEPAPKPPPEKKEPKKVMPKTEPPKTPPAPEAKKILPEAKPEKKKPVKQEVKELKAKQPFVPKMPKPIIRNRTLTIITCSRCPNCRLRSNFPLN